MKHTCGLDGDAGAVTPLDGTCVACNAPRLSPRINEKVLPTKMMKGQLFERMQLTKALTGKVLRIMKNKGMSPADLSLASGQPLQTVRNFIDGDSIPLFALSDIVFALGYKIEPSFIRLRKQKEIV